MIKPLYTFTLLIIISIFTNSNAIAQDNGIIDSILIEINNTKEDTAKINKYFELGSALQHKLPDTAIYFYNKANDLALKVYNNKKSDSNKLLSANSLKKLGYLYIKQDKFDIAIKTYKYAISKYLQIIKLASSDLQKNANMGLAYSYNDLGVIYIRKGNYTKADSLYNLAIKLFIKLNNTGGLIKTYKNLGLISYYQGNYTNSIKYFYKALELCEKINDIMGVAGIYNNIGGVNQKMGNYQDALNYYYKSLRIRDSLGNEKGVASSYNNIGVIYRNQKKYEKAINAYNKSLVIKKKLKDERGIAISYVNIGNVYEDKNDFNTAIKYFEKSLKYFEETGEQQKEVTVISNIAELYNNIGKYRKAIEFASKGLNIAKKRGILTQETLSYEILSDAYSNLNDYKNAFKYFKLFSITNDSLFNINKNKAITEINVKYETEKKQNEIVNLQNNKKIQSLKIERQKLLLILLIICIILILIISFLYFLNKNYKQKQLVKDIELQKEKLKAKAIIETQENEREKIARDLHDGIGQLLSAASIYFSNLSEEILTQIPGIKTNYEHSVGILNSACDELRTISHQMMPRSLIKEGLIISLEVMLSNSLTKNKIKYNFETFGMSGRIDSNKEIGLYRITQELIANIIKHAAATEVSVQLFKNKNMIILIVEDNGKGYYPKQGDGIGLLNISARVDSLNGSFEITNAPKKGTVATIRIPNNSNTSTKKHNF